MAKHTKIIRNEKLLVEQVEYPPGLYMPPHTDEVSRISIILDGLMNESTDFEDIEAKAGGLVIKPKTTVHENTFSRKPVSLLTICFRDETLFSRYFTNWQYIQHPKRYVEAIRLWTELRHAKNDQEIEKSLGRFATTGLPHKTGAGNTQFWVEQLKDLLTENLSETEFIYLISKKLSLHRVYAGKIFKRRYGISPSEFRKYSRVAAAFFDLLFTKKSLAAIAFDAGFSDQSHMNRHFRSYAGCTPGGFRQMMNGV